MENQPIKELKSQNGTNKQIKLNLKNYKNIKQGTTVCVIKYKSKQT